MDAADHSVSDYGSTHSIGSNLMYGYLANDMHLKASALILHQETGRLIQAPCFSFITNSTSPILGRLKVANTISLFYLRFPRFILAKTLMETARSSRNDFNVMGSGFSGLPNISLRCCCSILHTIFINDNLNLRPKFPHIDEVCNGELCMIEKMMELHTLENLEIAQIFK